ncbi:agmatine deiminase [Arthrobacter silviterrae]|uniref:Agmatine deiminase family protein n=1 Tax=Arthrobacter silviterrae TaxID=2026658 RepID=A0ABX0DEH5_9MICC|nr:MULTISPECIES: agmatine deiminase family protein [Arthrobacter]MCU6482423.1 agmatine deiminase family protein [Arthrobacter sp. A2-55]MDQ0277746.1 agmatine deiminase [Arthrobacter silviterrae]NGN84991.1 agmatine deiminase family protein [Arthrobacter silviterrae]
MRWVMPAETAPQERIWMAFPPGGYALGDTSEEAHAARSCWAAVANAAVEFEPVTMIVAPGDEEVAAQYLSPEVEVRTAPLDDAWMRDIGPTFVVGKADDGGTRLGAVDWVFNGWGAQDWASWGKDSLIGTAVAGLAGAERVGSKLVNEGGAIHVDGEGTVLVTETVQLDPHRNPGLSKADVEAELARTIGATHVIWLPRGLARDAERFGTRGHVDIVATIPRPGTLLVHRQNNPEHPDFAITAEIIEFLHTTRDAAGRAWNIIEVTAPETTTDAEGWVDYSYINHLVLNGGVIACSFDDPMDATAQQILADAYPGRRVVSVDARELYARGGGIHCITQQQPLLP